MTDYRNIRTFQKSQINGLTKHFSGLRFGMGSNHDSWNRIFDRAKQLGLEIGYSRAHGERLDFITPRKITREQTAFGKAWLKQYFFKLDGTPRSGKRTEYISDSTLKIAKSVARFEFVGVQILASHGWYPVQAVPIYRAFDRKGNYFDYSPVHWGEPIVMEG